MTTNGTRPEQTLYLIRNTKKFAFSIVMKTKKFECHRHNFYLHSSMQFDSKRDPVKSINFAKNLEFQRSQKSFYRIIQPLTLAGSFFLK